MSRDIYTFMGPLSNQRFAASVLGYFHSELVNFVFFFISDLLYFFMTVLIKCKQAQTFRTLGMATFSCKR